MTEEKYDVVIATLQERHDRLWKMTNTYHEWGIMDHIRLEQMDNLKKAIQCWKKYKHEWIDD